MTTADTPIRRKRRRIGSCWDIAFARAEEAQRRRRRRKAGSGDAPSPNSIVRDILTSLESQIAVQLLLTATRAAFLLAEHVGDAIGHHLQRGAAISMPTAQTCSTEPVPDDFDIALAPPHPTAQSEDEHDRFKCEFRRLTSPTYQAMWLRQYLSWRVHGRLLDNEGRREYPATVPHPCADRLPAALRAAADAMSIDEANRMLAPPDMLKRRLPDLRSRGEMLLKGIAPPVPDSAVAEAVTPEMPTPSMDGAVSDPDGISSDGPVRAF